MSVHETRDREPKRTVGRRLLVRSGGNHEIEDEREDNKQRTHECLFSPAEDGTNHVRPIPQRSANDTSAQRRKLPTAPWRSYKPRRQRRSSASLVASGFSRKASSVVFSP